MINGISKENIEEDIHIISVLSNEVLYSTNNKFNLKKSISQY